MKRSACMIMLLLCATGPALAQSTADTGVRESTDPGKIADVERRAEEIMSRQQSQSSGASASGASASSGETKDMHHGKGHKGKGKKDKSGAHGGKHHSS